MSETERYRKKAADETRRRRSCEKELQSLRACVNAFSRLLDCILIRLVLCFGQENDGVARLELPKVEKSLADTYVLEVKRGESEFLLTVREK